MEYLFLEIWRFEKRIALSEKKPPLEELFLSNYAYVFVKCVFLGVKQKSNNKFKFKKYLTKCCSQSQNRFFLYVQLSYDWLNHGLQKYLSILRATASCALFDPVVNTWHN